MFHSISLHVPEPVGRVMLVSSLDAVFLEIIYCYFAQSRAIKRFYGPGPQTSFGLIHVWFGLCLQVTSVVEKFLGYCRTHAK